MKEITIVSPFFNEKDTIVKFYHTVLNVLINNGWTYEIILVDDGSVDGSLELLLAEINESTKIVKMLKNVGHQVCLDVGVSLSNSKYVLTLDSDLQHPPDLIKDLFDAAKEDAVDVVYAIPRNRKVNNLFKRLTAHAWYSLVKKMSDIPILSNASDFRLISRKVVDVLKAIDENKVLRLLIPSLGFKSSVVYFDLAPRFAGKSKYTFKKMLKLSYLGFFSYTEKPIRLFLYGGLITLILSFLYGLFAILNYISGNTNPGWTSIAIILLTILSFQLIGFGLVAEYLVEIMKITKKRPRYLIDYITEGNQK